MIRYFSYEGSPEEALQTCKQTLEAMGYRIDFYAPESYLLVTTPQPVARDIRRYDYALAVYVEDYIHVHIIAQKYVFKRGSETSIGGKELVATETSDRLPYSLQQKIFFPLIAAFEEAGIPETSEPMSPKMGWLLKTNFTLIAEG
jgi:hypothetical protein